MSNFQDEMETVRQQMPMTPENVARVRSAIADCNRYIIKEGARAADLRPADVQARLDWCKEHRTRLVKMLG